MRRIAVEHPGPCRRVQIGEQSLLGVLARRRIGEPRRYRRRALHDVTCAFTIEQGQRVDQHQARDPVSHSLRHTADHHAARTGTDQHNIVQVFVEQQVGDFRDVGRCVDARAQLMATLGTTVHGRCIRGVACGTQACCDTLPDPTTLIRPVHQNERRHRECSLRCVSLKQTMLAGSS